MGRQEKQARDKVASQASAWVVRLADPNAPADQRRAFEAWRSQSPHHEVAYEQAAAAWERLDRLQALNRRAARADADLLAPRKGRLSVWRPRHPLQWAAAAISLAAAVVGAVAVDAWAFPAYATAVGERRVVVLADGTRAELNTNSKIVVHFHHGHREVVVVRGEALFKIKDDGRPFLVRAAEHARVQAERAELDVRIRDRSADIVVRQGDATASPQPAVFEREAASPDRLLPGADAKYGPDGVSVHQIGPVEVDRVLAWRQGAIELSGQTLAEAVEEFNRYNRRHLTVSDSSIARLRLAGYFQSDDLAGFVGAVTSAFPVRAVAGAENEISFRRRG